MDTMLGIKHEYQSPESSPTSASPSSLAEQAAFKIRHILTAHGMPDLTKWNIDLLLALRIYNCSKDAIICCAPHARERRNCYKQLSDGYTATGLFLVCRLAESFTISHEDTAKCLQDFSVHFLCAEKHRNDDRARQKLFDDWIPIIAQYQEYTKGRIVRPFLLQLKQNVVEIKNEGDKLHGEHQTLQKQYALLQSSLEEEVERRVGLRIDEIVEQRTRALTAEANRVVEQKDQLLRQQEEIMVKKNCGMQG